MATTNPMGKRLKIARVVVSVAALVMITLMWVEYSHFFMARFGWIERVQILPTAMAFSFGILAFWFLLTSLFGRIYCSSVCPLGTLQDAIARAGVMSRRGTLKDYHYSPPLTTLRYVSLGVVIACMLCGLMLIPEVVDPYNIYSQAVLNMLKPVWGHINNMLASIGTSTGWWSVDKVHVVAASAFGAAISVVSILAVGLPSWLYGRTFCNTICPVGTLLGLISKQSLWHIDIDTDLCTNCRRCEHVCKASCIDLNDHVVDGSRCVNCFNCLTACRDGAIFYRPTRKQLSIPMMKRISTPKVASTAQQTMTRAATQPATSTKHITTDETISRPVAPCARQRHRQK